MNQLKNNESKVIAMTTKQRIIDKINKIEDAELLEELDKWISSLLEATAGETFSEEEISGIREGYEQYRSGETLNQQKANQFLDEWLKGK